MKLRGFGLLLSVAAVCAFAQTPVEVESDGATPTAGKMVSKEQPVESTLRRARSVKLDLRQLPQTPPQKFERPEYEEPEPHPVELPGAPPPASAAPTSPLASAPAPAPIANFAGLDFATWGAGHPPDTNGDVGPTYYIQTINSSIGVYRKSDGFQVAAFTFNTFMSQGAFGNLCDTNNFGDPVVLYDTFEDRWVITDFAFQLDGGNNVVNPPGAFQCFAVSKTGDPVSGGWNFYSINVAGGLGDYPKFGIWTDGIYMSANVFGYPSGAAFQNPRVFAFNKAQMYAGSPTVQVVNFNAPSADFTVLPSNARLQTGTPPPGTPAYFVSTWEFTNALTVYKFHVDWTRISNSTFTGPDTPLAATSWPNAAVPNALSSGGNSLDVLQIRAMVQNQYTNIGGVESLWTTHTVRRQDTTGFAASRWYQVNVTGGTVNANLPQAATWDPDGANVLSRFVPSLAIDRAGDMALGYTTSSSTTKPALKYAGRLAGDPVNTFSQTEQLLIQGAGTQLGNCGSSACIRWGDYSAMTLDPDGCTFWYTGEYYAADGLNHQTRIGSFTYPSCTPVGAGGTISGTVTQSGNPLNGATVALGSRTTTTDGSGFYSFSSLPAGTYPIISASFPGCSTATANSLAVTDGNTTTQDFALTGVSGSACFTDTTQADFQTGIGTNLDLNISPGDVTLSNLPAVDQSNTAGTTTGTSFATTSWGGQTFIPAVTGTFVKADMQLFCSGCTGTTPNLTLSVRATSAGLPTGADLASGTLVGFSSGAGTYYTVSFGAPATLTSGTQYALILRPTANPSVGGYFWIRSSPSTYANGQRVISTDNGATWTADSTRDFNFRAYMQTGYAASGDFISGIKDANPAVGYSAGWTALSWTAVTPANTATAVTPANTSIKFQAAASNSASGPFNFVGPDGTAATFFTTSGASLSQFNGNRYFEYRAYLTSTDNTMTPTLNDVTVCYTDPCIPPPTPTVTPASTTTFCAGGSVSLMSSSATGNQWLLSGNPIGGATSQTYVASLSGDYTDVVTNGLGCASAASAATTVTINPLPAAPTISADTNGTGTQDQACPEQPLTLHANGSNGATSYQWYQDNNTLNGETNSTIQATGVGTYFVTATDANTCTSAQSAGYVVQNPTPHSPFISFRGQDSSVTSFAICQGASQIIDSDSATGIQWWKDGSPIPGAGNQSYTATQTGTYTAQLNALGCHSQFGRNVDLTVNPTPATPSVTPGGPTTFFAGQSVTLTSSSASGNQWYLNGSPIGGATNQSYVATASGSYTVAVTSTGCSSAQSAATVVTVNPAQADLALTLTDNRTAVMVGESVNYIIEVTNSAGPSAVTATVTDALPAGLINARWVCIPFGGANCASGVGNTLSDSLTLPVGSEAAYIYSATVLGGDAADLLSNTASVAVSNGTDPVSGNNSASDSDSVHIFIDGFEGTLLMRPTDVGNGADYVTATLRVDANLLNTLTFVPTTVASGRGADGKALFMLELARFVNDIALRFVTLDAHNMSQRSPWQVVDLQQHLLTFNWQSASSASSADGYIKVASTGTGLLLGALDDQGRLTRIWVTVQNSVPWLVPVTN